MLSLSNAEFYITNVCNLSCDNCNRFNNFAFKGHILWEDHKDQYKKWSEFLNIDRATILGGEPFANPDLINWIIGIRELWPDSCVRIVSNGTYLKQYFNLVKKLQHYPNIILEISIHGEALYDKIVTELLDQFGEPQERTKTRLHFRNGAEVWFIMSTHFLPCAISLKKGEAKLHNSDPEKANEICFSKHSHHFLNGKLYKCPLVAVLPEFRKQFQVTMNEQDEALLNAYNPIDISWEKDRIESEMVSFSNGDTIPQCKFCPDYVKYNKLDIKKKKPVLKKVDQL